MNPEERERIIHAIIDQRDEHGFHPGIYGAEVCQLCGELGTFSGYAAAVGSHFAGKFVSFSHDHVEPDGDPVFGFGVFSDDAFSRLRELLAARDAVFCEVCQRRVQREKARRVGHNWLCSTCTPDLLADLVRRRYVEGWTDEALRGWGKKLGVF